MTRLHESESRLDRPLVFRRQGAATQAGTAGQVLAQLTYAAGPDARRAAPLLLAPLNPVVDEWRVTGPVQSHRNSCIAWTTDGHWLFGTAILDERMQAGGLQGAAQQVYAEIFDLLGRQDCTHLLRVWNYLAGINLVRDGMERYRQFNIGRQEAFLAARRSAFMGAPAACAMGTKQGPLTVHFLAGRQEPRAVENPRQVSAYHYPVDYGPRSPSFSRAALADLGGGSEALFISGTASIVGHASLHPGDIRLQAEETLDNIRAVVEAASLKSRAGPGAFRSDQLDCTVYLRHASDLAAVREVVERRFGTDSPAARNAIYLQADVCRTELLVEIEAQAVVSTERDCA